MSISHCMKRTLDIARLPEGEWPNHITALPDACAHADCGVPRNCRQRAQEFLRTQWRIRRSLEAKGKGRG